MSFGAFNAPRTNDPKFLSRSLLTQFDKIEAPDGRHGQDNHKGTRRQHAETLGVGTSPVMPREVVEKYPESRLSADAVVGTGPFMMKSLRRMSAPSTSAIPTTGRRVRPIWTTFAAVTSPTWQTAIPPFTPGQIDISLLSGSDAKAYIAKQGAGFTPAWGADDTLNSMSARTSRLSPWTTHGCRARCAC